MKSIAVVARLALFGFATLGCSAAGGEPEAVVVVSETPDPAAVEPEYGVTAAPELLSACLDAAGRWETATGVTLHCDRGRPLRWETPGELPEHKGGGCGRSACVLDKSKEWALDLIATHELGHVIFGGSHPIGGSLMCWQPSDVGALISAEDLAWACSRVHCDRQTPEGAPSACPPEPVPAAK